MSTDRRISEWYKAATHDSPGQGYVRVSATCEATKARYKVDVPEEEWRAWQAGGMAQNVLKSLDADQREFLISGATPAEWSQLFGGEEP